MILQFLVVAMVTGSLSKKLTTYKDESALPTNSDKSSLQKRIIDGSESKKNEWPWLVNIYIINPKTKTYKHRCGGSLIDAQWVLTAAHCVVFLKDTDIKLRLGEHDVTVHSGDEVEHTVEYYYSHSRFYADFQFAYDIALVKITPPATYSKYVQAIALPPLYEQVPIGTHCLVAGWGEANFNSSHKSPVARHVEIPIVSYETCATANNEFPYSNVSLFSNICGGDVKTNKSACNGDSGGPLVCENAAGKYVLQGIVSWGDSKCGRQFYSVFTRVSSFIDWIDYSKIRPTPSLMLDCSKDHHYYCAEWKKMNYCKQRYVQRYCPKTCGKCAC